MNLIYEFEILLPLDLWYATDQFWADVAWTKLTETNHPVQVEEEGVCISAVQMNPEIIRRN